LRTGITSETPGVVGESATDGLRGAGAECEPIPCQGSPPETASTRSLFSNAFPALLSAN